MPKLSERKVCGILRVPRVQQRAEAARPTRPLDELLVARVKELIHKYPTFGYRRVWAMLRFRQGIHVDAKAVYRVLKQKRWFVHQRIWTPRPRVQGRISIAERSDLRWATDITHVPCGRDGFSLGKQLFFDTPGNPLSRPFMGKGEVKSCGTCHRAGRPARD